MPCGLGSVPRFIRYVGLCGNIYHQGFMIITNRLKGKVRQLIQIEFMQRLEILCPMEENLDEGFAEEALMGSFSRDWKTYCFEPVKLNPHFFEGELHFIFLFMVFLQHILH